MLLSAINGLLSRKLPVRLYHLGSWFSGLVRSSASISWNDVHISLLSAFLLAIGDRWGSVCMQYGTSGKNIELYARNRTRCRCCRPPGNIYHGVPGRNDRGPGAPSAPHVIHLGRLSIVRFAINVILCGETTHCSAECFKMHFKQNYLMLVCNAHERVCCGFARS